MSGVSKRLTIFSDGSKVFIDNTTSQVLRKTDVESIYLTKDDGTFIPFTTKDCEKCQDQVVTYKGRSYRGKILSEDPSNKTVTLLSNGIYIKTSYDSLESPYSQDDIYVVWNGRANLEYFTQSIRWESLTLLTLPKNGDSTLNFFGIITNDTPTSITGDIKLVKADKQSNRLHTPSPYQLSRSTSPRLAMAISPMRESYEDTPNVEEDVSYSTYLLGENSIDGRSKILIESFDIQPSRYTLINILSNYQNKGQESVVFRSPTYLPQGSIDIHDGDLDTSTVIPTTQRGEDVLIPLATSRIVKYKSNVEKRTNKISDYETETSYSVNLSYQYNVDVLNIREARPPILLYIDVSGRMVKDVQPPPYKDLMLKNKIVWVLKTDGPSGSFKCSFRIL